MNYENWTPILDDTDALMELQGRTCPECGHGVDLVAVGGIRAFYIKHYIVYPIRDITLMFLGGAAAKVVAQLLSTPKLVRGRKPAEHMLANIDAHVQVHLWNDAPNGDMDVGCQEFICANPYCRHKYEVYNTCVNDWSLVRCGQQPHAKEVLDAKE